MCLCNTYSFSFQPLGAAPLPLSPWLPVWSMEWMPSPTAGPGRYADVHTSVCVFMFTLMTLRVQHLAIGWQTQMLLKILQLSRAIFKVLNQESIPSVWRTAHFFVYCFSRVPFLDLSAVWKGRWVEAQLWRISDCCQLGYDCCTLHQVREAEEHKDKNSGTQPSLHKACLFCIYSMQWWLLICVTKGIIFLPRQKKRKNILEVIANSTHHQSLFI